MTKKNSHATWLMLLTGFLFLGSCDKCKDEQEGVIKVAIDRSCNNTINFSGDHVFGYLEHSGGFGNDQAVFGGYETGETRELGIKLPWPPQTGTYNLDTALLVSVYYDPVNTEPEDESDQYGNINVGTVTVVSVTVDGGDVPEFELTFSGIKVVHFPTGDTLCLNSGTIVKE